MHEAPRIKSYMSRLPDTVDKDNCLHTAMKKMKSRGFRHLPVLDGGKLVGVVSDRDLKWGLSLGDREKLSVEMVMTRDPIVVGPDTRLADVIPIMISEKVGCIIIGEKGVFPVGIFTLVDALKAFMDLVPEERNVTGT